MPEERIRTIGLYSPFARLMLHDKVETRWVKKNKKPPFPLGKYLIYATKKSYTRWEMYHISGERHLSWIYDIYKRLGYMWEMDAGYALCVGELIALYSMTPEDEPFTYVKYKEDENSILWCLKFKDVKGIEPFRWKYGKQGVGFVPDSELSKIKIIEP